MHYLMPSHKVLSPLDAEKVLMAKSIKLEELPPLMYQDAALKHLRMKGEDTPIGSVVEILVIRGSFSDDDDDEDKTRGRVKYRIIKGV